MSIGFWCLILAILFPYIFCFMAKTGPAFNNRNPREYLENLKGWRKRAHWVQLNSFEILPAFIAAFILGQMNSGFEPFLDKLAVGFILMRIVYAVCYIADKPGLRTISWACSFLFVLTMFLLPPLFYSSHGLLNTGRFKHNVGSKCEGERCNKGKMGMQKHFPMRHGEEGMKRGMPMEQREEGVKRGMPMKHGEASKPAMPNSEAKHAAPHAPQERAEHQIKQRAPSISPGATE